VEEFESLFVDRDSYFVKKHRESFVFLSWHAVRYPFVLISKHGVFGFLFSKKSLRRPRRVWVNITISWFKNSLQFNSNYLPYSFHFLLDCNLLLVFFPNCSSIHTTTPPTPIYHSIRKKKKLEKMWNNLETLKLCVFHLS